VRNEPEIDCNREGFLEMKSDKSSKGEVPIYESKTVDDEVIKHIDNVRKKVSRGRIFSDSAALIREMREERDKELDRAIRGNEK